MFLSKPTDLVSVVNGESKETKGLRGGAAFLPHRLGPGAQR